MTIVLAVCSAGYEKRILAKGKVLPQRWCWLNSLLTYPGLTDIFLGALRRMGVGVEVVPGKLNPETIFRLHAAHRLLMNNEDIQRVLFVGDAHVIRLMEEMWLRMAGGSWADIPLVRVDNCVGFGGYARGLREILESIGLIDRETILFVPITAYAAQRMDRELKMVFQREIQVRVFAGCPPWSSWLSWGVEYWLNRLSEWPKLFLAFFCPKVLRRMERDEGGIRKSLSSS